MPPVLGPLPEKGWRVDVSTRNAPEPDLLSRDPVLLASVSPETWLEIRCDGLPAFRAELKTFSIYQDGLTRLQEALNATVEDSPTWPTSIGSCPTHDVD